MAAAPVPAKGGNVLTRKLGPLPGWAWAAVAVGGFYLWKKRRAAAAAAASSTTSTAAGSPAAAYPGSNGATAAGSGYYSGPGVGYGGTGPIPTGATAATSTGQATTAGTLQGSGYVGGTSTYEDAQGNIYQPFQNQAQEAGAGSATQYVQTFPGVFNPVTPGQNLAPGTTLFMMTQPAANAGASS